MERLQRKVLREIRKGKAAAGRLSDHALLYAIEELHRRVNGGMAVWGMKLQDVWTNLFDSSSDPRIVRLRSRGR